MVAVPLQVILDDGLTTRNVGPELLDDLSFRSTIPGGFTDAQFALARPLRVASPETQPFVKATVIDTRNAGIAWQGRLDLPGRESGGQGEVSQITAAGPAAHVQDNSLAVVYVDQRANEWQAGQVVPAGVTWQTIDGATASQGSRFQLAFPRGTVISTSTIVSCRYLGLIASGQRAARVNVAATVAGVTNASHELRIGGRSGSGIAGEGATTTWDSRTASTASAALTARIGSGISTVGYIVELGAVWTGASTTVATDAVNYVTSIPIVQGERMDADGTVATGYTSDTIPMRDIVADLLGRFLPQYDGANADISTLATYAIEQLVYGDGVTAGDVLNDLLGLDPAFYWAAWEESDAGKARFEFNPYPTVVSYDLVSTGGFSSPGSAADLYNVVTVRYVDERGIPRTVTRTGACPYLDDRGLTRTARLDLGSEAGTATQATTLGDNFLLAHANPSNNGTITITEPVLNRTLGRIQQPWEIRPGGLVRVQNVVPRIDALNPSSSDAVSVFRMAETSYNAKSNTCSVTLDSYDTTVAKALARLFARQRRAVRR